MSCAIESYCPDACVLRRGTVVMPPGPTNRRRGHIRCMWKAMGQLVLYAGGALKSRIGGSRSAARCGNFSARPAYTDFSHLIHVRHDK